MNKCFDDGYEIFDNNLNDLNLFIQSDKITNEEKCIFFLQNIFLICELDMPVSCC
jgi:hypothetical protein